MDPNQFFAASRVFIVAGKGGVGKSTVSAALAVAARHSGLTSLLIETDGKPLLIEPGDDPGFSAQTLTPSEALSEYLESRGLRRISRRLVSAGIVDVVASAAPGIDNLLVLAKVKQLERAQAADVIIVDGPAAGHAITMLRTPRALSDSVPVGPVRQQADDVLAMLSDETRCQVVLVTMPEPTPVNECVETAYALEEEVGVKLAPVVVNQCDLASRIPIAVGANDMLVRAAEFRNTRIAIHEHECAELTRRLPLPQLRLSFMTEPDINHVAMALLDAIRLLPEHGERS